MGYKRYLRRALGGLPRSAPTLRGPTADKREIRDFLKLPSITSYIRRTLGVMTDEGDYSMRVTAFIGSARIKHTYNATEQFLKILQSFGDVEYEIVRLSDYKLGTCKGYKLCLDKGEELCPLKDDRDKLIDKMINSDGVIFASPNYSFQVSALMKIFLDRLGFLFHRPRFFGKTFTSIVAQGIYGGKDIVKYFNFIGKGLGFNVVKGCCITTLEPMTEKGQKKTDKIIDQQSKKFVEYGNYFALLFYQTTW